jgi:hypothetical protein
MRPRISGLENKRFGSLSVVRQEGQDKYRNYLWLCQCACGKEKKVRACDLVRGKVTSCSCQQQHGLPNNKAHGESPHFYKHKRGTPRYMMWLAAKHRAKRDKLPFSITLADITIPMLCPLLKIPLDFTHKHLDYSPSLDRIDTKAGYVKTNVWVVSYRANRIKTDASLAELDLLITNWKKRAGEAHV